MKWVGVSDIRGLRQERGLSLERTTLRLAAAFGTEMSAKTLERYESARRLPPPLVSQLAALYGVEEKEVRAA